MEKNITFDDFYCNTNNNDETNWVYICRHCIKKYNIDTKLLDTSGGGDTENPERGPICSVKGCNNVAEAYLDIPKNIKEQKATAPEWTIPLTALQKKVKVWARIGITLEMTTEQYQTLQKKAEYKTQDGYTRYSELTLSKEEAELFLKNGTAENDSYIPQEVFEDIEYEKEQIK